MGRPEEWEKEIDWMLKKRLNLFMLRIGMDDVFQKAFPDIVPYPPKDEILPEAKPRSFYDRTTAWPLEYRGKLRKPILDYAFERELIHPEDMGTMTHWYSCTPKAFLETVKPTFNPQSGGAYLGDSTNAVWDIRDDKNLDYSMNASMRKIESVYQPINPAFEQALKGNSENDYCRSYVSEYFDRYYLPQLKHYVNVVNAELKNKDHLFPNPDMMDMQHNVEEFYRKPLKEMQCLNKQPRDNASYHLILINLADLLDIFMLDASLYDVFGLYNDESIEYTIVRSY